MLALPFPWCPTWGVKMLPAQRLFWIRSYEQHQAQIPEDLGQSLAVHPAVTGMSLPRHANTRGGAFKRISIKV